MRPTPITLVLRLGNGSRFDNTGDAHAMREEIGRSNTLDVAGDVRRIAHSDVSPCHWHIYPSPGLSQVPFSANILNQVGPDANPASADSLE